MPVGGSDSGSRNIVTTPANFSQTALYSLSYTGGPAFLSFNTDSASLSSPDTVIMGYSVTDTSGAVAGIYALTVTYDFLDSGSGVIFTEVFDMVVEVMP